MDKNEFVKLFKIAEKLEGSELKTEEMDKFQEILNNDSEIQFKYLSQELGELLQAASKYLLSSDDKKDIVSLMEEIGDGIIVIYGFARVCGLNSSMVNKCVKAKMMRHMNRINSDN